MELGIKTKKKCRRLKRFSKKTMDIISIDFF
jgi:hypothetical protein